MKQLKGLLSVLLAVLISSASAGEADHHAPYTGSGEFERLKSLQGYWEGTAMMQGKQQSITVDYKVTSAGSAVVETHFRGTPKEMVSVYSDISGKPGMTHYCAMKNRPNLVMKDSTDNSLFFDFTDSPGIDPQKDGHMHALTVRFIDKDTIEQEWVMYQGGKAVESSAFTMKRVNSL